MPSQVSTAIVFIATIIGAALVAALIYGGAVLLTQVPVPDFPPTPYCESGTVYFQIRNVGRAPLDLSKVKVNGQAVCGSGTLQPGEAKVCSFSVQACPTSITVIVEGSGNYILPVVKK